MEQPQLSGGNGALMVCRATLLTVAVALSVTAAAGQTARLERLMRDKLAYSQNALAAVVTSNWAVLGLEAVPTIERAELTPELLARYGDELESLDGEPFEGVVLKAGGWSCKVVNKWYDSKK